MTYRAACLIAALALASPVAVFAQALPWQGSSAPQTQPMQPAGQPQHHHHGQSGGQGAHKAAPDATRAQDDRKLDELATRYYAISSKDPKAIEKLGKLEREVKVYNSTLKGRSYDASDIMKDTRKLQGRISTQRKKLELAQAGVSPAAAAPVTTPAPVPAPAPTAAVPPAPAPAVIAPLPQTQPMIAVPPAR